MSRSLYKRLPSVIDFGVFKVHIVWMTDQELKDFVEDDHTPVYGASGVDNQFEPTECRIIGLNHSLKNRPRKLLGIFFHELIHTVIDMDSAAREDSGLWRRKRV